ncbi:MAG: GDP-mannose 4,6-dehydratase [Proteobacteria bacterium]|nr:GDP-mannose 4,6-dehydratase [Pseudomonadota bacterium]
MAPAPSSLRRILITGAEGFVGRALAARIRAEWPGITLTGTSRQIDGVTACHERIVLDLAHGDITEALHAAQPDAILHLAARSSVAQGLSASAETFDDNVTGTLRLAKAVRQTCPGAAFLFASSGEVYGRSFNAACPITEDVAPAPQNAYARSKLAGEFAVTDVLASTNPVIILRLFNHFGPGQDERFVIPAFASQLRRIRDEGAPTVIRVGNLDAIRDFLPIGDVLAAYGAALALAAARGPSCETFNISSGTGRSIRSVLNDMIERTAMSVTVDVDPARLRPSDIPRAIGDSTRFRAATGWQPDHIWSAAIDGMFDR